MNVSLGEAVQVMPSFTYNQKCDGYKDSTLKPTKPNHFDNYES